MKLFKWDNVLVPDELEKAYIGGFFDGEGCVTLSRDASKSEGGYSLSVLISNTNISVLEFICKFYRAKLTPIKPRGNSKPSFQWCIKSRKAMRFLEDVLPHLKVKAEVAKLGIYFQRTKKKTFYPQGGLKEDEVKFRLAVKEQFRHLNRRGAMQGVN